ncbi:MAG: DegT/DnrJ/EryC1/StrS family aminotransferase, partial [Planctomycetes bacterium]|nr:DegT/DnrJ/EryC1/StrS family aminotransferase [Planctomycetota bacterium]
AQYQPLRESLLAAVTEVFESQRFILGETVARFETEMARTIGFPPESVIGVSSGTDALLSALMALGVGPGDRVLTTPFSFFATAGVVSRLGATPVFCDIDPQSFNLDPKGLSRFDPQDFKAIVVVHLFGRCAEIAAIRDWAAPARLPVVEDAAQAIGATDAQGRPCGTLGEIGCFSFFPTKNLGAAGDGGAQVAVDPELAARLRRLRTHGGHRIYDHEVIGGNFRLDALQAAVLTVKLPHLAAWTAARLLNARAYDQAFRDAGLAETLGLPEIPDDGRYVAHQYVIRSTRREALAAHLAERGIGTAVYYPKAFHQLDCFRDLGYAPGDFPEAERAAREALALPIFPELGAERRLRVVDAVGSFDHARA